jgi:8-oxo-dGTP pyrophosphatase MutT (NUDIX family)
MNIHCSDGIVCPKNLNFLHEKDYIRRAGIIPFIIYNGITYILLGLSKDPIPVWADLGGRTEIGESTLQTAIREFNEESRYVLSIDLNRINKILINNRNNSNTPDQVMLIIHVDPNDYNLNINKHFQNTIPKTQYEDEMSILQWFPYDYFLSMDGLSSSMQSVQTLLKLI